MLCDHCQRLDAGWRDQPPPPHRAWTWQDHKRGKPSTSTRSLIRAKAEEHRQLVIRQRAMIHETCTQHHQEPTRGETDQS